MYPCVHISMAPSGPIHTRAPVYGPICPMHTWAPVYLCVVMCSYVLSCVSRTTLFTLPCNQPIIDSTSSWPFSSVIILCHTRTNTTLYLIRIVPRFPCALLGNSPYANTYGPLWPYSYTLPVCTYVWPSLALFTHPY